MLSNILAPRSVGAQSEHQSLRAQRKHCLNRLPTKKPISFGSGAATPFGYTKPAVVAAAVAGQDGRLVRFPPRLLAFAREYDFYPCACTPGAASKKGNLENGGLACLHTSFSPLRSFTDLAS